MNIIRTYSNISSSLNKAKNLPFLLFRLVLAYGFYGPAAMKWGNIGNIAEWFGNMGIPFPTLNAYLAASTEVAAVILLPLGLATRFISIPLMFTMIVAIVTVHLGNGFEASNNGFEIPFYYLLMLFALFINGPGKISFDHLISRRAQ